MATNLLVHQKNLKFELTEDSDLSYKKEQTSQPLVLLHHSNSHSKLKPKPSVFAK